MAPPPTRRTVRIGWGPSNRGMHAVDLGAATLRSEQSPKFRHGSGPWMHQTKNIESTRGCRPPRSSWSRVRGPTYVQWSPSGAASQPAVAAAAYQTGSGTGMAPAVAPKEAAANMHVVLLVRQPHAAEQQREAWSTTAPNQQRKQHTQTATTVTQSLDKLCAHPCVCVPICCRFARRGRPAATAIGTLQWMHTFLMRGVPKVHGCVLLGPPASASATTRTQRSGPPSPIPIMGIRGSSCCKPPPQQGPLRRPLSCQGPAPAPVDAQLQLRQCP